MVTIETVVFDVAYVLLLKYPKSTVGFDSVEEFAITGYKLESAWVYRNSAKLRLSQTKTTEQHAMKRHWQAKTTTARLSFLVKKELRHFR